MAKHFIPKYFLSEIRHDSNFQEFASKLEELTRFALKCRGKQFGSIKLPSYKIVRTRRWHPEWWYGKLYVYDIKPLRRKLLFKFAWTLTVNTYHNYLKWTNPYSLPYIPFILGELEEYRQEQLTERIETKNYIHSLLS